MRIPLNPEFDYLDEFDGENIVTESEEKLDYVRL